MIDKAKFINVRGRLIDLSVPKIMGILNITPDSFYTGSRFRKKDEILKAAGKMLTDGADFLDVGGYSSRPGAKEISVEEEKERVLPAIDCIAGEFPDSIISVDTFRSEVADIAVKQCGASIINDISAWEADPLMFSLIAELNVPYILMHMKGTPSTMQVNPEYGDIVPELLSWFGSKIAALKEAGIKDIIIDPGFGFGKTVVHNFQILKRLKDFEIIGFPILAGLSRKSMIWRTLETDPASSLNGTTALNAVALMNSANILRVHDVKEAKETIRLISSLKE
jgi:dihydropteroate synthase